MSTGAGPRAPWTDARRGMLGTPDVLEYLIRKRPKDTLLYRYTSKLKKLGARPAVVVETPAGRTTVSMRDVFEQATICARALLALDLAFGETTTRIGCDHAESIVFEQGVLLCGGWMSNVPLPLGDVPSLGPDRARISFVQDGALWAQLVERGVAPEVEHLIVLKDVERANDPRAMSWEAFLSRGQDTTDDMLAARQRQLVDVDQAMRKNQWDPPYSYPTAKARKTPEFGRLT